ncbi:MAG TPA: hypothetical protein VL593_10805 [Ramlibacter sp.]|nr:hypothetical protein [Ramlibacter sp.]
MDFNGVRGTTVRALPTPSQDAAQGEAVRQEQPIDVWRSRLTGPGFRDIETNEVPDEHAQGVAELCLELAAGHHANAAKRVLSMNANVRAHAMALLKAEPPRDADQQSGLALCILDAGYPIPLGDDLADAVTLVVQGRDEWEEDHWAMKAAKFEPSLSDPPDPTFCPPDYLGNPPKYQGKGLPHYYDDPKYSLDNLNGLITPTGLADERSEENLVCKQLQKGADEFGKDFLTLPLEQGANAAGLDREQLTQADEQEIRETFGVNFEQEHFGALLRELCRDLPIGVERSFRVGFRKNEGHVMRVLLKREPATDEHPQGVISVQMYEPSVTRNRIHMKVLPERLAFLHWDQFDVKHKRERGDARVLNLRVRDRKIAAECAGKFVSPTHGARVAGLSQALAIGDHKLVESLLQELAGDPAGSFTDDEIADLEGGLTWAIQGRDVEGIELFMNGLGNLRLSPEQMARIAMARGRDGKMSLAQALNNGHDPGARRTVMAFVDGLRALRLGPEQIADIFCAEGASNPPLLSCIADASLPDEFGRRPPHLLPTLISALKDLGLEAADVLRIVNRPNKELLPALMANGDWVGVTRLMRASRQLDAPDEFVAACVVRVIALGFQMDQLLGTIAAERISSDLIVQRWIGPDKDGRYPLRLLIEVASPPALDALSRTIEYLTRDLKVTDRKNFLQALEAADGGSTFFGQPKSEKMKTLKKRDPDAYRRYKEAKAALRG